MFRELIAAVAPIETAQNAPDAGPPEDLPGPVPEFVTDLLDGIRSFVGDLVGGIGGRAAGASVETVATGLDVAASLLG